MASHLSTNYSELTPEQTPKFFNAEYFTGNGRTKSGLINASLRPSGVSPDTLELLNNDSIDMYQRHGSSDVIVYTIPFDMWKISSFIHGQMLDMEYDPMDYDLQVPDHGLSLRLVPQAGILRHDKRSKASSMRQLSLTYRVEAYHHGGAGLVYRLHHDLPGLLDVGNSVGVFTTNNAPRSLHRLFDRWGIHGHDEALDAWLADFPLYRALSEVAAQWTSPTVGDQMSAYVTSITRSDLTDAQVEALRQQMRYLNNYEAVSLVAYRAIYQVLAEHLPDEVVNHITRQNMNLLMNQKLARLESLKDSLTPLPANPGNITVEPPVSDQQLAAITNTDPLIMVQAGAGSGKSSTVRKRIDYMCDLGVDPSDITVLSFTNNAADNIKMTHPRIGSMTISTMIHKLYKENHPDHRLSNVPTIINSLDIFYPKNAVAHEFRQHLNRLRTVQTSLATMQLNNFVEDHFDEVMRILDTISQTSLELEIIITYQTLMTMREPDDVSCRYLIIDEVQDNSIFDFIVILRYIEKHHQSLFIVGDSSQTLYAFRGSNPKALNALEVSGVFTTKQLTTNYRSNQEILEFANETLKDIEANQHAKIVLSAHGDQHLTKFSFADRVHVEHVRLEKMYHMRRDLLPTLKYIAEPWLTRHYQNHSTTALLSYMRQEVETFERALRQMYPDAVIVNLQSAKSFSSTFITEYIKRYWNDVLQVAPADAVFVITNQIMNNLPEITPGGEKAAVPIHATLRTWLNGDEERGIDPAQPYIDTLVRAHGNGMLTNAQFFEKLRVNLIQYEIDNNAMESLLAGENNKKKRTLDPEVHVDFYVGTIHSAKGLEFPNVLIVHEETEAPDEEKKRMYYVSQTRAMETEYLLTFGTEHHHMLDNHQRIIDRLPLD